MVSNKLPDISLMSHSKRLKKAVLMGDFKQRVFGAPSLYSGSFFGAPTITVPSKAGAPGSLAEGPFLVLIGDRLVLEHSPYTKDTQVEVSHRQATGQQGGSAARWDSI